MHSFSGPSDERWKRKQRIVGCCWSHSTEICKTIHSTDTLNQKRTTKKIILHMKLISEKNKLQCCVCLLWHVFYAIEICGLQCIEMQTLSILFCCFHYKFPRSIQSSAGPYNWLQKNVYSFICTQFQKL